MLEESDTEKPQAENGENSKKGCKKKREIVQQLSEDLEKIGARM